ncbi:MAG TPA: Clp protease N-terminal domain-containing protein [Solirubrobacteraceae bacterium]
MCFGSSAPGEEASSGQIPFTPRAKKVLELSLREALSLGHDWIGPEHILLGLAREGEGVAARILSDAGAEPNTVRVMVEDALAAAPRPRVSRLPRPQRKGSAAAWLTRVHPGLDRLDREIRDELGREPDDGDLLLVLASMPGLVSGQTLAELGVDPDALWGVLERVRRARSEAAAEVERQREQARLAKEAAIEARNFAEAARLRDQERELAQRRRSGPESLNEIRRLLGLPPPPD